MNIALTNLNELPISTVNSSEVPSKALHSQEDNQELCLSEYHSKPASKDKITASKPQLQQVVIEAMCDLF
ncbi:MAG: hypothetical protein WA865_15150 [Spirulinaceae cyanobacterium]